MEEIPLEVRSHSNCTDEAQEHEGWAKQYPAVLVQVLLVGSQAKIQALRKDQKPFISNCRYQMDGKLS